MSYKYKFKHSWQNNVCVHCGLKRKTKTWKLRMAIVGNKDYYQYGTKMAYWDKAIKAWTFYIPPCSKNNINQTPTAKTKTLQARRNSGKISWQKKHLPVKGYVKKQP